MAITFTQQKKRQSILMIVLGGAAIVTAIVLWQGFFAQNIGGAEQKIIIPPPSKVTIDFFVFEHPIFETPKVQPKEPILPEEVGRENPFLPF